MITAAQWAALIMLGANLIVFCVAALNLARHYEFRLGTKGSGPRRILRGVSLQVVPAVWRGMIRLVIALICICALAAAMGVGAWIVLRFM